MRLGLVGLGKIARDQHLSAIARTPGIDLVATASPNDRIDGVPGVDDLTALLAGGHALDAVAVCTPPAVRVPLAEQAIAAGLHVMLEKPPAPSVADAERLADLARRRGVALFAAWHSREAGGVEPARHWLADKTVTAGSITWREDIRRWHPGQDWILEAAGLGVFDPAINALSILTRLLHDRVVVRSAKLGLPANAASPVQADLVLGAGEAAIDVALDFLATGEPEWRIALDTDGGTIVLDRGGSIIRLPGLPPQPFANEEYPRLYARFRDLVFSNSSDIDLSPLALVEQALAFGERYALPTFAF